jgi:hypothetical protein
MILRWLGALLTLGTRLLPGGFKGMILRQWGIVLTLGTRGTRRGV